MGDDLSAKCCKTGNKSKDLQVAAERPLAEVPLANRSPSRSCSDTDDVTCCQGTDSPSLLLHADCYSLAFADCCSLVFTMHTFGSTGRECFPSILSSLLLPLALEDLLRGTKCRWMKSSPEGEHWTFHSRLLLQHKETLVSSSLTCTRWLSAAGKSQWLC